MNTWNDIDTRLASIGKDRRWLADATPYTYDTIRNTLAPNATKRTDRMLSILLRAIEDEEKRQAAVSTPTAKEIRPGVFEIFQTEEQLHTADLASRVVGAPSLTEFCRDVILDEAARILDREAGRPETAKSTLYGAAPYPVQSLKVADVDPAKDDPPSH